MDDLLRPLLDRLRTADTLDDAALALLEPVLRTAATHLRAGAWSRDARVLRGMLHLRPDDGYRGLVVATHRGARPPRLEAEADSLPSATAWRWLATHRRPVEVDVRARTLRPVGAPDETASIDALPGDGDAAFRSRQQILSRDATHLLILPLRTAGEALVGMVSVEVSCPRAVGTAFGWEDALPGLLTLVDVAAPTLLAVPVVIAPPASGDDGLRDARLPVLGQAMRRLVRMLDVFARQEETLLLSGPTGSGKSRLARWCHERSPRADGPFEHVDLTSTPEETQLAELFGWTRGAFTGAVDDRDGAITRAAGGTLFLDEVDKLSPRAQAGLLHLFEERRFRPLGASGRDRDADVRFVIGTNADLREAVEDGRLLEDLYYRIHVLPVQLLPLRERRDEIADWARFMARRRHREGASRGEATVDDEAAALLRRQPWPGNLRQLDNVVRRAYALALVDGGPDGGVAIQPRHVEGALGLERRAPAGGTPQALWAAAVAFVRDATARQGTDEALSLDDTDVLRGLVLAAAEVELGDREAACALLGKASLVAGRNHHRLYARSYDRAREVLDRLGGPLDAALLDVLDP